MFSGFPKAQYARISQFHDPNLKEYADLVVSLYAQHAVQSAISGHYSNRSVVTRNSFNVSGLILSSSVPSAS